MVIAITLKRLARMHQKSYFAEKGRKMGYLWGFMRPDSNNSAAVQVPSFEPNEVSKRVLDVIAAAIAIILFAPILLIVAIVVKLNSQGPIFVRETK